MCHDCQQTFTRHQTAGLPHGMEEVINGAPAMAIETNTDLLWRVPENPGKKFAVSAHRVLRVKMVPIDSPTSGMATLPPILVC